MTTTTKRREAKHWCFTLNNPLPDDYKLFYAANNVTAFCFQLEKGKLGTPHYQGYIHFTNKCSPYSQIPNKRIHWEVCKDINQAIIYCQKLPRIAGPWLKGVERKTELVPICSADLRPWQNEIISIISKQPHDRHIYWYWEPIGNTGKTTFAKYLVVYHSAVVLSGKSADMKNAIASMKHYPQVILVDCPRSGANFICYKGLEEIKNALFFSGKYESKMVCGHVPHLIIFSNSPPEYAQLSQDRWVVTRIPALDEHGTGNGGGTGILDEHDRILDSYNAQTLKQIIKARTLDGKIKSAGKPARYGELDDGVTDAVAGLTGELERIAWDGTGEGTESGGMGTGSGAEEEAGTGAEEEAGHRFEEGNDAGIGAGEPGIYADLDADTFEELEPVPEIEPARLLNDGTDIRIREGSGRITTGNETRNTPGNGAGTTKNTLYNKPLTGLPPGVDYSRDFEPGHGLKGGGYTGIGTGSRIKPGDGDGTTRGLEAGSTRGLETGTTRGVGSGTTRGLESGSSQEPAIRKIGRPRKYGIPKGQDT